MRSRHLRSVACAVLLACAMVSMVQAGTFQLTPIYGEAKPGESVLTYTVTNRGTAPITVQIDAQAWDQDPVAGDRESPTAALIIAPRIMTVAPGEHRPARIALRDRQRTGEAAFRVTVTEIPPPPTPGETALRTVIAQKVPLVFSVPGEPGPLQWRVGLQRNGQLHVQVGNPGRRFIRVVNITVADQRGAILAKRDGGAYILAGKSVGWLLATPARLTAGSAVRVQYELGGHRIDVPLTVE